MLIKVRLKNFEKSILSGRSQGGVRDMCPPGVQILSIPCSFLGKFGKIVCCRLHLYSWHPYLGEILDPPLIFLILIITVKIFSLCLKKIPCITAKFPVFCLCGRSKNQISCFPYAMATHPVLCYWLENLKLL